VPFSELSFGYLNQQSAQIFPRSNFSLLKDEDENVEKSEKDQYLKEKSLEELKIENDRLKSQQSFVRDQLNEKN
jgi:hypothetical protein